MAVRRLAVALQSLSPTDTATPSQRCVSTAAAPANATRVRLLLRTAAGVCTALSSLELAVLNPTTIMCTSDVLADVSTGTRLRFASLSGYGGATGRWDPCTPTKRTSASCNTRQGSATGPSLSPTSNRVLVRLRRDDSVLNRELTTADPAAMIRAT
jgi:hypothetical protein